LADEMVGIADDPPLPKETHCRANNPEHLVSTVPFAEARVRQYRLRAIEEFEQCPHLGRA
jgi:hypothetical protein